MENVKKFGYPDLVGVVAALVAIAFVPGLNEPLTYPKLFVLAAGGIALLPAALWRWRKSGRNPWFVWVVAGAAALLVLWGVISMIGSGAPLANSLFGWWGRGDGWLALLGAVSIFLGASTLDREGIARAITWMLGGATIASLVGLLQVAGVEVAGSTSVTSLMGNTNFAAGYFAMIFSLALGRALMPAAIWQRAWAGVLALVMAFLAYKTDAIQGPVALLGGAVAFGVFYSIAYRGRFRAAGLIASAVVILLGVGGLVMSFIGVGPLAALWSDRTFAIRQQYWQSGWNILNAHPVFGTGPDGFARYVAEYRPESYVELLGPVLRVSAAHNIPLQIGATMGWVALVLWLIAMLGTAVLLIVRVARAPVWQNTLTASVGGALAAYLIQGIVSIDMLPVLATGWAVAGLAFAAARESLPVVVSEAKPAPGSGKGPQSRKAKAAAFRPDEPSAPAWVPITGGVLGLLVAIAVGAQIAAVSGFSNIRSQEEALSVMTSALTPCPPRSDVSQNVLQQVPAEVAVPALQEAQALDPRCSGMTTLVADVAIQQGDLPRADEATAFLIETDPLFYEAWVLRGLYEVKAGNVTAAQADLAEAQRVNSLYPDPAPGEQRIATLQQAIDGAG